MAKNTLIVELIGDPSSLNRALNQSKSQATTWEAHMKGVSKTITRSFAGITAGLVGAGGVIAAFKLVTGEFNQQQKAAAATNAVLASTSNVAGLTAKNVDDLAKAIGRKTTYDKAQIQSAENMLLTFTNIRNVAGKGNDIFNQTTMAVTDMSAAFKAAGKSMDISNIAILVGKALQDPIKGMTSLRRVGVALTDQQTELVKHLVATGQTMQAQKLILGELTTEFGGSAAAQTRTLSGQLEVLKNRFADWGSEMITRGLPTMKKWLENTVAFVNDMKRMYNALKDNRVAIDAVIVALGVLALSNPWLALAAGAVYVITHWEKVKTWFLDFGNWLRLELNNILNPFIAQINSLIGVINKVQGWAVGNIGTIGQNPFSVGMSSSQANRNAGLRGIQHAEITGAYSPSRTHYSVAQMAALWTAVGGDPSVAQKMAYQAYYGESGGSTTVKNKIGATGLWQILQSHNPKADYTNAWTNAQEAVTLYNKAIASGTPISQVWTNPVAARLFGGGSIPGATAPNAGGGAPAAAKAISLKIPDILSAAITKAKAAFTLHVSQAHLDSLVALQKKEEAVIKAQPNATGAQDKLASVAAEIKTEQAKLNAKIAQQQLNAAKATIGKIEKLAVSPEQALKLAEAAGQPAAVILADQQDVLNAYQTEAAKLQAAMATSKGKAKTAYATALATVRSNIASATDAIASTLQTIADTARTQLANILGMVKSAAEQRLGSQYYQGGLQTPSEALLSAMQAEDTRQQLQQALTDAITAGDPAAIAAAQRSIAENDLANQAVKERAQADADYAKAVFNLDTQIDKYSQQFLDGKITLKQFDDYMTGLGVPLQMLADPGGNGLFDQLSSASATLVSAFNALIAWIGAQTGNYFGGEGSGVISGNLGAGSTAIGSGGQPSLRALGFASGGIVPGALGAPMLAVVHGGETVIPAGKGAGHTYVFNFPNLVGSRQEMQQLVVDALARANRNGLAMVNIT